MSRPETTARTATRRAPRGGPFLAAALACVLLGGCGRTAEGDPCQVAPDGGAQQNPCAAGLTCQTPAGCAISYCCPTPAMRSSNANCNGTACAGS